MKKETVNQILRYGIAGIFNTCIGLSIIYLLKDHIGVFWANSFNMVIGMVVNFFTSKKFTFKSKGDTKRQSKYFFIIFIFCAILNLTTIKLLVWEASIINALSWFVRTLIPEAVIDLITAKRYLSLTGPDMIVSYIGVVVFASFNFSLNKYITFKKEPLIEVEKDVIVE